MYPTKEGSRFDCPLFPHPADAARTTTTCSLKAVGRIMFFSATPGASPWVWTIAPGYEEDRSPTHGHAATSKPRRRRGPLGEVHP